MFKLYLNYGPALGWLILVEAWDYETEPQPKLFKTRVEAREYADGYGKDGIEYKILEENC